VSRSTGWQQFIDCKVAVRVRARRGNDLIYVICFRESNMNDILKWNCVILCLCCTLILKCAPLSLCSRFTVVTRTKHTSLPVGADKYRLAAVKP
jgi:hypothetical protein